MKNPNKKARPGFRLPLWLTIAISATSALAAIVLWVLHFPDAINSFSAGYPKAVETVSDWMFLNKKLSGTWTSDVEGWIDATDEDRRLIGGEAGPVIIQIRVYAGEAEGEIVSEGLKKKYVFSRIMLKGNEQGGQVEAVAYDYIEGKPAGLAKIQISHLSSDGPDTLRFKTLEQGGQFFPPEARLHRDANAMPDDLGQLNPEWMNSLLKAVRDAKKKKK